MLQFGFPMLARSCLTGIQDRANDPGRHGETNAQDFPTPCGNSFIEIVDPHHGVVCSVVGHDSDVNNGST